MHRGTRSSVIEIVAATVTATIGMMTTAAASGQTGQPARAVIGRPHSAPFCSSMYFLKTVQDVSFGRLSSSGGGVWYSG